MKMHTVCRSLFQRSVHLRSSSRSVMTHTTMLRGLATRDAPLPPLVNPVENAIAAAQQRGELNHLSGAGKPLPKANDNKFLSGGGGSADLLASKAEFEMRRAMHHRELDYLEKGQKLEYKGTNIVSSSLSGGSGSGGGDGDDAMAQYILREAKPSVEDLKKATK